MTGNYDKPTWAKRKLYYFYMKRSCVGFKQQQRKPAYDIWANTMKL